MPVIYFIWLVEEKRIILDDEHLTGL